VAFVKRKSSRRSCSLGAFLPNSIFLDHSAVHWGYHAHGCSGNLHGTLLIGYCKFGSPGSLNLDIEWVLPGIDYSVPSLIISSSVRAAVATLLVSCFNFSFIDASSTIFSWHATLRPTRTSKLKAFDFSLGTAARAGRLPLRCQWVRPGERELFALQQRNSISELGLPVGQL
jgi:hypothetical protein